MLTAFGCSALDSKDESILTCSAAARCHHISKANRRVCCASCTKGSPSLLFWERVNTSIGINIPCLDINRQAVINGRSAAGNKHVERTGVETMQVNGADGKTRRGNAAARLQPAVCRRLNTSGGRAGVSSSTPAAASPTVLIWTKTRVPGEKSGDNNGSKPLMHTSYQEHSRM